MEMSMLIPRATRPQCRWKGMLCLLVAFLMCTVSQNVSAEWYVAGYGGWSMPDKLKHVRLDTFGERIAIQEFPGAGSIPPLGTVTQSLRSSDLSLQQSPLFGGKAGYFFSHEGLPWLGVEVEVFTTKPTIKNQTVSTTQDITYIPNNPLPAGACVPGIDCLAQQRSTGTLEVSDASLRLITVAFNVVARYPGAIFQPYVGVGAGAFYFKGSGQFDGRQVVPGLNAMVGLKVLATEEWGFFLEGKYSRATISNFDPTYGLSGEYSAFHAVAGLAYHF